MEPSLTNRSRRSMNDPSGRKMRNRSLFKNQQFIFCLRTDKTGYSERDRQSCCSSLITHLIQFSWLDANIKWRISLIVHLHDRTFKTISVVLSFTKATMGTTMGLSSYNSLSHCADLLTFPIKWRKSWFESSLEAELVFQNYFCFLSFTGEPLKLQEWDLFHSIAYL